MTFQNNRKNQPKPKPPNTLEGPIKNTAIAVEHAANAVCKTSTLMHDMMHELRDSKIWSLIIRKNTGPKTPDGT